ncbi:MAG: hypothetical protein HN742_09985 [Lentisphaerae bacterium]|jgi:hypothetical protein|nr:hypothetical protein [Lentisphaerota bacterium]MBT5610432.1 hypothetical protein [Lentisphaerota bacterium]MBT7061023.1 hypothetical protein [Lentisphaerota bacterium]MBT7842192.1 hypothetical protein [Lentisphaerota bacterium]
MNRLELMALTLVASMIAGGASAQVAPDTDGDGMPDLLEERLGTHPDSAETFSRALDEGVESEAKRQSDVYLAALDVVTVDTAHSGDDRFVWRVTFAETPRPEDTVLHLYVDADLNRETGRKTDARSSMEGVELMVTMAGAQGRPTLYLPDGTRGNSGPIRWGVHEKALYLCADADLARTAEGAAYELFVLCHLTGNAKKRGELPDMSDSSGRVRVGNVPLTTRKKLFQVSDLVATENTDRACGMETMRRTFSRPDAVVKQHDELELDGFEVDDFTSRRYGHVKRIRPGGLVRTTAPAGRYHVAFAMYDDSRPERVVFRIDGDVAGVANADCGNYRHWVFWLESARQFKGGEAVELIATGTEGKHGICAVMFLPTPPPKTSFAYEARHLAAFTPHGEEGTVLLSWTTKMPSRTLLEYGTEGRHDLTSGEAGSRLVHRVRLTGLDPEVQYNARAVGFRPDETRYESGGLTFRPAAPPAPPTVQETRTVPLTVRNPHEKAAAGWPVTNGVPFPQGVLASGSEIRLLKGDREVLAQIRVTARWLDNSVKWILVSFLADVPADGKTEYTLEYGRTVQRLLKGDELVTRNGESLELRAGPSLLRVGPGGELILPGGKPCRTTIRGTSATIHTGGEATVTIEENGPVRAVVKTVSELAGPEGSPSYAVEQRIEVFRGNPFARVHHTFVVSGSREFSEIEEMDVAIPISSPFWSLTRSEGKAVTLPGGDTIRQRVDDEFVCRDQVTKGRLTGAVLGDGGLVCLRNAWQNYPKAFTSTAGELHMQLCPDFEPGFYDAFPFEKEGHHLYFYLLNGRYKFRQGMAKTHELLICPTPLANAPTYAALFQRPLLAMAPPEWMCATQTFYDVVPRDTTRFRFYEEGIDDSVKQASVCREMLRDYGLMNFGDTYGERGTNWTNIEYDLQHALLMQYIRSGDEEAFFRADETEKHNRDIDTCQRSGRFHKRGFVYIHQIGHVGGYYDKPVPGALGWAKAGGSVTHAWAEGHFNHYFVTGDRRSYETGLAVADYHIAAYLSRPYEFTSCRMPGWHLIMNAIAYASTSDPYYLNASRVIVDRVLETQDRDPRPLPAHQCEPGRTHQLGTWSRMMVPGHCHCLPRHQGNAGFMVAILLSGLKYYHDVTGEEAVKQAIIAGARGLVTECYSTESHGFRYTSCPKTSFSTGSSPLMLEGIARAYRWTQDPDLRDPLLFVRQYGRGWRAWGKGFASHYRVAPRLLADLAACGITINEMSTATIKRKPFIAPGWMKGDKGKRVIVVQAEDFAAEGDGQCQKRRDRNGIMGQIITYWHQELGHWLEWRINVPASGPYLVRLHYATDCHKTRRALLIDGASPTPEADDMAFPRTGGFGGLSSHWAFRGLLDATGEEIPVNLAAGQHTLRMSNLADGLALDFIALVPQGGK